MMVAIDVAIAILTARSGATSRCDRMNVMNGTMIIPPPMPSSPARKPVAMPSRASSTRSGADSDILFFGERTIVAGACAPRGSGDFVDRQFFRDAAQRMPLRLRPQPGRREDLRRLGMAHDGLGGEDRGCRREALHARGDVHGLAEVVEPV